MPISKATHGIRVTFTRPIAALDQNGKDPRHATLEIFPDPPAHQNAFQTRETYELELWRVQNRWQHLGGEIVRGVLVPWHMVESMELVEFQVTDRGRLPAD